MKHKKAAAKNKAPAVIIAPEHQSAPNIAMVAPPPAEASAQPFRPSVNTANSGNWYKEYDAELDRPEFHNPSINAEIAEMQRRGPARSCEQMIDTALAEHAKSEARVREYRWDGQERWQGRENEEMRVVNIMHPHTFIERLQRAGISATLEADAPGAVRNSRLWLNSWSKAGRVGLNAWVRGAVTTVSSLQYPYGPEWSVMRFDEHNLPTNEKYRGWRTALLALIMSRVVTEEEAERAFGKPLGVASLFYREQLFNFRKVRMGLSLGEEAIA